MDNDAETDLKLKINQFIWENGPDDMTLQRAEVVATWILSALTDLRDPKGSPCTNALCRE